ncbi:hypothetical protein, partial [Pseudoalteromonas undina]
SFLIAVINFAFLYNYSGMAAFFAKTTLEVSPALNLDIIVLPLECSSKIICFVHLFSYSEPLLLFFVCAQ